MPEQESSFLEIVDLKRDSVKEKLARRYYAE